MSSCKSCFKYDSTGLHSESPRFLNDGFTHKADFQHPKILGCVSLSNWVAITSLASVSGHILIFLFRPHSIIWWKDKFSTVHQAFILLRGISIYFNASLLSLHRPLKAVHTAHTANKPIRNVTSVDDYSGELIRKCSEKLWPRWHSDWQKSQTRCFALSVSSNQSKRISVFTLGISLICCGPVPASPCQMMHCQK